MATTHSAVLDRVRDVCVAQGWQEAPALGFELTPTQATSVPQFVVRMTEQPGTGGMGYTEESRGDVDVQVLRLVGGDVDATRRTVFADLTTLLSEIVRDGASDGNYAVEDGGRSRTVEQPRGAGYVVGTLRVAVNFESQL